MYEEFGWTRKQRERMVFVNLDIKGLSSTMQFKYSCEMVLNHNSIMSG